MKLILLFIVCVISVNALSWMPPLYTTNCGFTRADALNCVLKYGDTNKDGKLTRPEIKHALDVLVPNWIKKLSWFTGVTVDQTMSDCDYNEDGVITVSDWTEDGLQDKPKCMPTKKNLCTFQWFCEHAKKNAK